MRFRRSRPIVMAFYEGEIGVHNFVRQSRFACSLECVGLLADLEEWHSAEDLLSHFPEYDIDSLSKQIYELVWLGAVVVESTPEAEMDQSFRDTWQWGMAGGHLHFITRDAEFPKEYTKQQLQANHSEWGLSEPSYYADSADETDVLRLKRMDFKNPVFDLMRRRRSDTKFTDREIDVEVLADCLFAGKGVLKVEDSGPFAGRPVTMTPSAEACNPYELYVYSRNVGGLVKGFYHYLTASHALRRINGDDVNLPDMLGGQAWTGRSAAVIFLVAHFPRTMWTLHKPLGYRMVLMEAGFVAQNIALVATQHGFSAVPIGSFKHSKIEAHLPLPPMTASVMLCIALG